MAQFKNLHSLFKHIEKNIDEVLQNEVAQTGRQTMKKNIESEVYSKYTPKEYKRDREDGGLLDDANIPTTLLKSGVLSISSNRTDGNTNVSKVVTEGIGYTWENSAIYNMQPYPRRFVYQTFLELERTLSHLKAMKDGLRKRGFRVK